jgi:hypothetical protein
MSTVQTEPQENHSIHIIDVEHQGTSNYCGIMWNIPYYSSGYIVEYIWLVVWNMAFIFPYIGKFIIQPDELHHFSEG